MVGSKALERCVRVFAALAVLGAGFSLPAFAGPEEDFLEGMKWAGRVDYVTAIPHLKKAADAGHPAAAAALASILNESGYDEESIKYYRKAVAAGSLVGMYGLAGVLASDKKEFVEARALFEKAAELGYTPSVQALAQAYIHGELGIPEDQRKGADALKWITRAADTGYIRALEVLELAYRTGDYGLAVDVTKAEEIKKKIASLKPPPVQKKRRRGESK